MSEDKIIAFIREIANAMRAGRAEYLRAYKEALRGASSEKINIVNAEQKTGVSSDYLLIETARKLGINTEGKTKEEISSAIVEKFQDRSNKTVQGV
jgi:hypothetical protein